MDKAERQHITKFLHALQEGQLAAANKHLARVVDHKMVKKLKQVKDVKPF